ncbi:ABC transporter, substrate-binding protein (cluster 5, nickel/peptides/opines) [hydrothermal vent metagenome]|uniref:ABC transporter, substrate-binding protein (Cluster 5, nickel/peptides/opines) n=1 Tax=hydrothermal vent metagenome TaxID=652676 RepID=A0A3B1BYM8_9ZZZZ
MTLNARRACLVLLFLILAACHKKETIAPNTLVIGIESGPRLLDPRLYTDAASSRIGDLLFNGLVQRGDDFSIQPDLAESWETPSPVRYIFHLRPGVYFHDGQKLISKDIVASFNFVLDPANKSPWRSSFLMVDSVATPDDETIIFDLKKPSAPFLGFLTMGITPAKTDKDMGASPVGTGPFKFVDYKTEERLTLVRYDSYFDGRAKLEGVVFKIIPDETVRVLSLEKGAVHLIMNPITPNILPRFKDNPNLKVVSSLGTNYSYLGFNMKDPLTGKLAVRKAVAYAIDRRGIIKYILKGLAEPASGPLSPALKFYEGDVSKYDYDPAKARRILDDAGLKDPDGDGPKMRFTLKYSTSQNELRKRIAEVFQFQLGKVGIGLDIRSYEWGTFYSHIKKGNFQIFSLTWVGIVDPDILYYIFNSSSTPPDGANRGHYKNRRVDELTELGRVTFGEERKAAYSEIQKIIADDLPYVSLWHSVNVAVMDKRVEGFVLAPDENLKSLKNVTLMTDVK